jgi:hypothetical protein
MREKIVHILAVAVMLWVINVILSFFSPESSGKFEMTGIFVSAEYSGSLRVGGGEEYNTTSFSMILTTDEYERVDRKYDEWSRKSGPGYSEDLPEGSVYYGRESTGNWCGELPEPGTRVRVSSPSGYTNRVTITDLDSGEVYKSRGSCERPVFTYYYRVMLRKTGEIIAEGVSVGPDVFEAMRPYREYYTEGSPYAFQVWEDGEPTPAPFTPEP